MITHLASPDELDAGELEIRGAAYRHLFRARRLASGARLRLVDGAGRARWGVVAGVSSSTARIHLGEAAPANEPGYRLTLVVAPPRGERASWLVEKATEIGAFAVRFLACERTPPRASVSLERLRRVAAAALVQCHRARLPAISGPDGWDELPTILATAGGGELSSGAADLFYLDPEAAAGELRPGAAVGAVVIGPEGGFTDAEGERLAALGGRAVGLGPRILRIETAAVAAASGLLLRAPC